MPVFDGMNGALRQVVRTGLALLLLGILSMPVQAEAPPPRARLAFVGDIMLGRNVGTWIASKGTAYPFADVATALSRADLAFGNMESPLATTPMVARGFDLRAEPAYAEAVYLAGFDVLSLANNHSTDNGRDGLLQTMATLSEWGIDYTGAGETLAGARAPLLREVNGLRIAYLAYDETRACFQATSTQAGAVWLEPEWVVEDVAVARQQADIVVVSFHWGDEYQPTPNAGQRAIAARIAAAGADLIIGHHPHVVQPVEWVHGEGRQRPTLVAYSLGNFLFDQWFSDETMQSAILFCDVGPDGVLAYGLQPVWVTEGRTEIANQEHGRAVLSRLLPHPRASLWQSFHQGSPALDLAPAIWWLSDEELRHGGAPASAVDPDGWETRIHHHEGALSIHMADGRSLTTPAEWYVWDWTVLDRGRPGRHLVLSVAEPPAWHGTGPVQRTGFFRRHSLGSQPTQRLYIVQPGASDWRVIQRTEPLSGSLLGLACLPSQPGVAVWCAAIERDDARGRGLGWWQWDGRNWKRAADGPVGTFDHLTLWDATGDGFPNLLAGLDDGALSLAPGD